MAAAERERLYDAAMAARGGDLGEAERLFQRVIATATAADRCARLAPRFVTAYPGDR